jgi:hypothetical protein
MPGFFLINNLAILLIISIERLGRKEEGKRNDTEGIGGSIELFLIRLTNFLIVFIARI